MKSASAIITRMLASGRIGYIITLFVIICATSSGDVVLSNGNYTWLAAVFSPFFFVLYDYEKLLYLGASKKDISRVFNAETLIVGFAAGAIGIGVSLLLLIPINLVLHTLTGIESLSAILPVGGAVILVIISMALTLIAGLIPSGIAAKKDPVEALRTE